jgi:1-acyl-sn-glycerol-3-phosphate acyltransferase
MRSSAALPSIAKRQLGWFTRYLHFYLRRNFHGVHLLKLSPLEDLRGWPLLVCLNHPSWWDPLMGAYLSQRFFKHRNHYAPIAAAGLAKYRFFERLGFFGIDPATRAGAFRFLEIGESALSREDAALWVTPEGNFIDVRRRPIRLQPGVGHLTQRLGRVAMLPVALEYSFWNERYPEAFACFGRPVFIENGKDRTAREWTSCFSGALERTLDLLSERVQRRDPSAFEPVLAGSAGVGGIYDLWRALKSRLQAQKFQPEHGGTGHERI